MPRRKVSLSLKGFALLYPTFLYARQGDASHLTKIIDIASDSIFDASLIIVSLDICYFIKLMTANQLSGSTRHYQAKSRTLQDRCCGMRPGAWMLSAPYP